MRNAYLVPALIPSPDRPDVLMPALVRDPSSGVPLPEGGAFKPLSAFWLRRLADVDVVEGVEPIAAAPTAPIAGKSAHKAAKPR